MSNTDQAPEPTMDEILASIRRIISDEPTEAKLDAPQEAAPEPEDSVAGDIARALNFGGSEETVSTMDDDILELTEIVETGQAGEPPQFDVGSQMPEQAGDNGLAAMNEFTSPPGEHDHPAPDMYAPDNGSAQGFPPANDMPFNEVNGGVQAALGDPAMAGQPPQQDGAAFADQDIFGEPPSGIMAADQQMQDGATFDSALMGGDAQMTPDPVLIDSPALVESEGMDLDNPAMMDTGVPIDTGLIAESLATSSLQDEPLAAAGEMPIEQDAPAATDTGLGGAPDISDIADQLAQEIEQTEEPIEARGWDEGESQVEEQLVEDALKERLEADGAEAAMSDFDAAVQSEEVLANDENVTFGELSPEESIESALEKAIQSDELTSELADDLEQAWADDSPGDQPADTVSEVQQDVAAQSAEIPPEVQKEAEDNMELSRVENSSEEVGVSGMEDELSSAVASVKETVTPDLPAEATERAVETVQPKQPDVSEVVPAMPTAPVGSPFEESIKDMLKPMLKEWLDDNMPRLLEGAMKEARELENKKK